MNNNETCYLKNKEGKYLKVRRVGRELKLCIVELQDPETVTIRQRYPEGGDVEMAFEFRHSEKHCSPKVEENSLKLEWCDDNSDLPDSHWFKKVDVKGGDIYCLQSVVPPKQYVCLEPVVPTRQNRKSSILGLCLTQSQSVRLEQASITD